MEEKDNDILNDINNTDDNDKDKLFLNSVKVKKIKDLNFYDVENATSTFQKIINRYHRKRQKEKKRLKNIAAFIQKARNKAENFETEDEYMVKELKRDIKLDQELQDLFGQRAKKHYIETNNKKFKLKVNKIDFFTPKEFIKLKEEKNNSKNNIKNEDEENKNDNNNNNNNKDIKNKNKKNKKIEKNRNIKSITYDIKNLKKSTILKKKKIKILPELTHIIFQPKKMSFSSSIFSNKRHRFFNTFHKELKSNNNSSSKNSTKMKSFYKTSSNIKNYKYNSNYNKNKSQKNFNKTEKYINIIDNNKTSPKRIKNETYYKANTNFRDMIGISQDNILLGDLNKNKTENGFHYTGIAYLNKLAEIKRQFVNKEKEFKNYFRNNDYGCTYSKMQFRYLTKKFFQ